MNDPEVRHLYFNILYTYISYVVYVVCFILRKLSSQIEHFNQGYYTQEGTLLC